MNGFEVVGAGVKKAILSVLTERMLDAGNVGVLSEMSAVPYDDDKGAKSHTWLCTKRFHQQTATRMSSVACFLGNIF